MLSSLLISNIDIHASNDDSAKSKLYPGSTLLVYVVEAIEALSSDLSFLSPKIAGCKIMGVKVRGVYKTWEEANKRSKQLQEEDSDFDVFVGEVGKWLPMDPDPHDESQVKDQVYYEKELQRIAKANKNEQEKVRKNEKERKKQQLELTKHENRQNKTRERLQRKLAEKRRREQENKVLEADPNAEATSMMSSMKGGSGVKKSGDHQSNMFEENTDVSDMLKESEKRLKDEKKRLTENTCSLTEKEENLSSLKNKLEFLQNAVKKRADKRDEYKNQNA